MGGLDLSTGRARIEMSIRQLAAQNKRRVATNDALSQNHGPAEQQIYLRLRKLFHSHDKSLAMSLDVSICQNSEKAEVQMTQCHRQEGQVSSCLDEVLSSRILSGMRVASSAFVAKTPDQVPQQVFSLHMLKPDSGGHFDGHVHEPRWAARMGAVHDDAVRACSRFRVP